MLPPAHRLGRYIYVVQIARPYLVSKKGLLSFKKKELTICKIISLMLISVVVDCPSVPFGMDYGFVR